MTITRTAQPITASDDELRAALADAFLPALLPALAHSTGDFALLEHGLLPENPTPGMEQAGMSAEQQQRARDLAFDALLRLRDAGGEPYRATGDDVRRIIVWMTNGKASPEYTPLLLEELAVDGDDPRAPRWRKPAATDFSVAIIGAGMSGILAAIRLKQAGIPFTIFEKNEDVGGTWFENTYPGARVDVGSAFYSYSFAQKVDWPNYFSPQKVLLQYFRDVADEHRVREHIRFCTEVREMRWDDERARWSLCLRTPGGNEETVDANAVVAATGQLNRPRMPEITGMDTFRGPSFHSARWDHTVDLHGKHVAVIGTGASAAQFVPEIARDVTALDIYQRTPGWFVPVPMYHEQVPSGLLWMLTHVPNYMHWYRFWFFWMTTDGLLPAAMVDDAWPEKERSVSMENEVLRLLLSGYIQGQFADRPDLLEKCMPAYPPASKRMILDNGIWADTLKRDNVELITDRIDRITPESVVTVDGVDRPVDVIVYGTGFRASEFLLPMTVVGRGGIDINAQWAGAARAYMGVVVPNFPNFFMLYGPNTNIVVNGSITYFSECEVQYLMGCLRLLFDGNKRAFDVKRDVHDAYNERIDAGNSQRAWGVSSVNTWYKNAKGHISQNWPFNVIEYWQQTREANPDDFVFS